MASTTTIDRGKMNKNVHTFCAFRFFIVTSLAVAYNTFIYIIFHSKTGKINTVNLYFNYAVLATLVMQLYINLTRVELEGDSRHGLETIIFALEWTLTMTVLASAYLMTTDFI